MVDRLHVATLNLRHFADRWDERLPLVLADMRALQPDLLGLQECLFPLQQDRLVGAAGPAHYRTYRGWGGRPEYGNSLLVREPLEAGDVERLDLGRDRCAISAAVRLPAGGRVLAAVTHLHHVPADEEVRDAQVGALVEWLDALAPEAQVIVGDFNAEPDEPAYARMTAAGFRSAHFEANGDEPPVTWPSGLQAPAIDTDGQPGCLDYVWVRGPISVEACRLAWDRPDVDDPGLFPSDHFGLSARLRVGA